MKKLLLLIAICLAIAANAQVTDSKKTVFGRQKSDFSTAQAKKLTADFKKYKIKTQVFSVYNATTNRNDTYWKSPHAFTFSRSKLLLDNFFSEPKYDSFNPTGSEKFNEVILAGVLESVLSKLN